ncbi:hypothetical protein SAMN05446589_10284 [Streptomyces sp. OV198]|nr:hypothetical protein SAMN05446589_10284 [Streptomyces sp. OV198]
MGQQDHVVHPVSRPRGSDDVPGAERQGDPSAASHRRPAKSTRTVDAETDGGGVHRPAIVGVGRHRVHSEAASVPRNGSPDSHRSELRNASFGGGRTDSRERGAGPRPPAGRSSPARYSLRRRGIDVMPDACLSRRTSSGAVENEGFARHAPPGHRAALCRGPYGYGAHEHVEVREPGVREDTSARHSWGSERRPDHARELPRQLLGRWRWHAAGSELARKARSGSL